MIRYEPVLSDATALPTHRNGFIAAYQEAFSGHPYNEHYTRQQVLDDVWYPHLDSGVTVLALEGDHVVGFGCAQPLLKAPNEVRDFLEASVHFTADLAKTWYMSELGVLNSHRYQGIGYQLVRHRLLSISHRGITDYAFRTAADSSNSIHLYRKIGAKEIPDLQDVSGSEQVLVNQSQSTERVYLHGKIAHALSLIPA